MLLLAVDTSTAAVCAALADDTGVLQARSVVDARGHGEWLASLIDDVLGAAGVEPRELTDIAVGVGPGPFTGLRVGIVTARVMGATLGIPVHGFCSLDVLGALARLDGECLVATDARRREVYWARYDASGTRLDGPSVDKPDVVAAAHPGAPVVGPGAALYPDAFPIASEPSQLRPEDVAAFASARLRSGEPMLPTDPLYLRRPDAQPQPPRRPAVPS